MPNYYSPLEPPNSRGELGNGSKPQPMLNGYVEWPRAAGEPATGSDSFLDYWNMLVRQRKALLRFTLAGLALAILISILQTPSYRARTSLEIRDFDENFLDPERASRGGAPGSETIAESYFETQIKILQSESLLERVIVKLKLHQARPASGWGLFAMASRVRQMLEPSQPAPSAKEDAIRELGRHLTVRAAPNTRLLEVLYEDRDPKVAADFANTLVSEFIEQSQEMRWKSTRRAAEWLTGHLGEMKSRLEQSEAQLHDYARNSGLTFTTSASERDNIADIRLRDMQSELSRAHADRVAREAKFEEAKGRQDSLPEMMDDATLREHRLKLTDLQRQLVELTATLTPEHYKVQRVQAQIAELQAAVRKERGMILSRIRNEYVTARRREKFLTDAYGKQEKIVADQSSKAIHYDTLKREVDSTRRLYEAMLQRVKQAELASAMRASNVLVVDSAKPPLFPHQPKLLMNSALGLFAGAFFGFGFVLFRERFDRRIQSPGEARAYLNLPELGVIPVAEFPHAAQSRDLLANPRQAITSWLAEVPFRKQIGGNGNGKHAMPGLPSGKPQESNPGDCPEMATWNRKPSLLAESFRATLTSILLPGENGVHPRVVVVTSPIPGDGKTTVACNLSIAMAETGRKVLLVDGDLRRPRVHKVFCVSNSHGLTDLLMGNAPMDETVPTAHLVCESGIAGLSLLPGGCGTANTSSLLYSPRMTQLLERVRRDFDMVLVDAPPMIHLADARVLGRLADGVVLVVRSGQTPLQSALFACQRFAEDGTRLLGTVLNSWHPDKSDAYAYEQYVEKYEPQHTSV